VLRGLDADSQDLVHSPVRRLTGPWFRACANRLWSRYYWTASMQVDRRVDSADVSGPADTARNWRAFQSSSYPPHPGSLRLTGLTKRSQPEEILSLDRCVRCHLCERHPSLPSRDVSSLRAYRYAGMVCLSLPRTATCPLAPIRDPEIAVRLCPSAQLPFDSLPERAYTLDKEKERKVHGRPFDWKL
jgi:hypothetical protein